MRTFLCKHFGTSSLEPKSSDFPSLEFRKSSNIFINFLWNSSEILKIVGFMEKLLNKTLSGKMKMGGGEPKSCYRISFVAYTPTFRHSYTVPTGIGSLCNSNRIQVEFERCKSY